MQDKRTDREERHAILPNLQASYRWTRKHGWRHHLLAHLPPLDDEERTTRTTTKIVYLVFLLAV